MTRTTKLLALRADSAGCALYRVWEPINAVRALGGSDSDLLLRDDDGLDVDATMDSATGIYTVHEIREDVDVLLVQRPVHNYGLSLIEQARRQGIGTIVDIDDALEDVHRLHCSYFDLVTDLNATANATWVRRAAEAADLVTVSTPALAEAYPGARVLPNFVPRRIFRTRRRRPRPQSVAIGWPGLVATHPTDLLVVGDAVRRVISQHGAHMIVVGTGEQVPQQLGLRRVTATGMVPLHKYYQTLADYVDIGIVPLEDNAFNRAKSYLKLLEMSALGIPVVASPTAENARLHEAGVGILASSPAEWEEALGQLAGSARLRREVGQRSREAVLESFVYDQHAHLWRDAWTSVVHTTSSVI